MMALSKIVLVIALILLLPTGLVLASQDAVPGDATYSLKRTLENAIISVASLHPATSAYFKVDFSKRRFRETLTLIRRGSDASNSLGDLVSQTKSAADSVSSVSDKGRRKELADELLKQIDEYNKGLKKYSGVKAAQPTPIPTPTVNNLPPALARARGTGVSPTPSPSAPVSPSVLDSVGTGGLVPVQSNSGQDQDVQQALDQINELRRQLEQVQRESASASSATTPTATPTTRATVQPTATPTLRPSPTPTRVPAAPTPNYQAVVTNPTPTVGMGIAEVIDPITPTVAATPPTDTSLPIGAFSVANCSALTGSAVDADAPSLPTPVDFWLRKGDPNNADLPYNIFVGEVVANSMSVWSFTPTSMSTNINDGAHTYNPQTYFFASKPRDIWAAAIDINSSGARGTLPPGHTGLGVLTVTCGMRTLN